MSKDVIATALVPLLLQLVGLASVVFCDRLLRPRQRRTMLAICALVFLNVVTNYPPGLETALAERWWLLVAADVCGYAVRPAIIVLFMYLLDLERGKNLAWTLVGLNAALYLTAFFSPIAFAITADGSFLRGPLGYACHVISAFLLAWSLVLALQRHGDERSQDRLPMVVCILVVSAATLLDSLPFSPVRWNWPSWLSLVMPSACVFLYLWLHLRFEREHERALEAEQRIRIMMSQIQPHFLYNTLTTIQSLCLVDPAEAARVTERFGTYLRRNIDSLSQAKLIPFAKELEHTRVYVQIEMTRFPNINVTYDIEDVGFEVPTLTLQPIVENAIRHGVRVRERGEVCVTSLLGDAGHVIEVRDNGKGFDVERLNSDSLSGNHIGIANVRERIGRMCGGTLTVASVPGEGTTVTIVIPTTR